MAVKLVTTVGMIVVVNKCPEFEKITPHVGEIMKFNTKC